MKICSNGILEIGSEDTVEMLDFLNWPRVKAVKLFGNVSIAILQALPAHVTRVGLSGNVSVASIQALPAHVTTIEFYSSVPMEILQAIEVKGG